MRTFKLYYFARQYFNISKEEFEALWIEIENSGHIICALFYRHPNAETSNGKLQNYGKFSLRFQGPKLWNEIDMSLKIKSKATLILNPNLYLI